MNAGDTFHYDPPNGARSLCVLLTDADANGVALMVRVLPVRKNDRNFDDACVIPRGHHACSARHDVYLDYDHARDLTKQQYDAMKQLGRFAAQTPLGAALLKQALQGAIKSMHASPRVKGIVQAVLAPTP